MTSVELKATKSVTTYAGTKGMDYIVTLVGEGVLHMSGSRYFNGKDPSLVPIDEDTDFDFYCQYIEGETEKILERFNCRVTWGTNAAYPLDGLAVGVVELHDEPVQIILRSNAALYTRVQSSISVDFYRNYLWKRGPNKPQRAQIQDIYNQLFKIAETGIASC